MCLFPKNLYKPNSRFNVSPRAGEIAALLNERAVAARGNGLFLKIPDTHRSKKPMSFKDLMSPEEFVKKASEIGIQSRWALWCVTRKAEPEDPELKNIDYIFWIQKKVSEFKKLCGLDPDAPLDGKEFDKWLIETVRSEMAHARLAS